MTLLSPRRQGVPVLSELLLLNRGKVRDLYNLGNDRLLMVATDGISIFDCVLNALIPQKGRILTALSHFWLKHLENHGIPTHLIAAGAAIDEYLPAALRNDPDLQSRSMVVRRLEMRPIEFVVRGFLTGSGLKSYRKTQTVCGHRLPQGLEDGDELPRVLDTPTTKAAAGHDEALDAAMVRMQYPEESYWAMAIYEIIARYAWASGIIFADTKLEFGVDGKGVMRLGDEVGTGDSSRWWSERAWRETRKKDPRKAPHPFDKQLVRALGIEEGIDKLDPAIPEHVALVHQRDPGLPEDLIAATTHTYRYIFWRLTGYTLEQYLMKEGCITESRPRIKVALILGSESDIPFVQSAIKKYPFPGSGSRIGAIALHIMSCHRNPLELYQFVCSERCHGVDAIIAAGGKAFALPGVIDALVYASGQRVPVIGVALGDPGTEALEAAKLSIKQLPGQPVMMDEIRGEVYAGEKGLQAALERLDIGELPPPSRREEKLARFNVTVK